MSSSKGVSLSSILEATGVDSRELNIVGIKYLSPHDLDLIADKIKNCPYLDQLTIEVSDPSYVNSLTCEKFKRILPAIMEHPSLTKIILPNSRIDGLEQYNLTKEIVQNTDNNRIHTLDFRSKFKGVCSIHGSSFPPLLKEADTLVCLTTRDVGTTLLTPPKPSNQEEYDLAAKNILFHGAKNYVPPHYLVNPLESGVSRNLRESASLLNVIIYGRHFSADGKTTKKINDRLPAILWLAEQGGDEMRGRVIKTLWEAEMNKFSHNIPYDIGPYITLNDAKVAGIDRSQIKERPKQPRGIVDRIFHPGESSLV